MSLSKISWQVMMKKYDGLITWSVTPSHFYTGFYFMKLFILLRHRRCGKIASSLRFNYTSDFRGRFRIKPCLFSSFLNLQALCEIGHTSKWTFRWAHQAQILERQENKKLVSDKHCTLFTPTVSDERKYLCWTFLPVLNNLWCWAQVMTKR
jgi:hypothetical protein